jgi:hypothetical protein
MIDIDPLVVLFAATEWRHDTQPNGTLHNDTQPNDSLATRGVALCFSVACIINIF